MKLYKIIVLSNAMLKANKVTKTDEKQYMIGLRYTNKTYTKKMIQENGINDENENKGRKQFGMLRNLQKQHTKH